MPMGETAYIGGGPASPGLFPGSGGSPRAAGPPAKASMATPTLPAPDGAAPACAHCGQGAEDRCAACFVGMVQQVISHCGSMALAESLAVALADFMGGSHLAHIHLALALDRSRPFPAGEAVRPLEARFGLTQREARVALLLAEGHANKEIARLLYISPHTARHHTQHLMLKLGARSRTAAAALILGV